MATNKPPLKPAPPASLSDAPPTRRELPPAYPGNPPQTREPSPGKPPPPRDQTTPRSEASTQYDEPPDPRNREAFQEWLETKPREWSVVIAAGAALRVLPLARTAKFGSEEARTILLPVFRAIAIARFAAVYPNQEIADASATASNAAHAALRAVTDRATLSAVYAASAAAAAAAADPVVDDADSLPLLLPPPTLPLPPQPVGTLWRSRTGFGRSSSPASRCGDPARARKLTGIALSRAGLGFRVISLASASTGKYGRTGTTSCSAVRCLRSRVAKPGRQPSPTRSTPPTPGKAPCPGTTAPRRSTSPSRRGSTRCNRRRE